MHIVGIPVATNCNRGMKKQVGKSELSTKDRIIDKLKEEKEKNDTRF